MVFMAALVINVIRRICGLTVTVSRDEAIRIAVDYCAKAGWPWQLPVHVSEGLCVYHMMTNASMKGGNVFIRVRVTDGKVVSAGFARR